MVSSNYTSHFIYYLTSAMLIMFEMMKMMYTIYYMPEIQYLSDTTHFITQGEIQIEM